MIKKIQILKVIKNQVKEVLDQIIIIIKQIFKQKIIKLALKNEMMNLKKNIKILSSNNNNKCRFYPKNQLSLDKAVKEKKTKLENYRLN